MVIRGGMLSGAGEQWSTPNLQIPSPKCFKEADFGGLAPPKLRPPTHSREAATKVMIFATQMGLHLAPLRPMCALLALCCLVRREGGFR